MTTAVVVVDVQCFKTSSKTWVCKELAVYDGTRVAHYIFKSPFPFHALDPTLRSDAYWLTKNHHSISWDEGLVPSHLFEPILQRLTSNVTDVYVKGRQKAEFIRSILKREIMELPEKGALQQAEPRCFYHSQPICICALNNVYTLYNNHFT